MTGDFIHLFRGNPAAVGLDDAGHGKPGPLRLEIPDERDTNWKVLAEGHLAGMAGIGVYPVNHARGGSVAWGCVDFDEGEVESWSHALNLRSFLNDLDVPSWIERSRSKGYHLWVFSEWVPALWMRRLLYGACVAAEAPTKEVNPKSEKLEQDQLGNFVRLPYFGITKGKIRHQVIVDLVGEAVDLREFLSGAMELTVPAERVTRVGRLLYEPCLAKARRPLGRIRPGPWQDRLNGLGMMQLQQGPRGEDRSSYLMAFGYACAESGLAEDEIVKAVRVADLMHCHKYEGRKDAPDRYGDIARKAIDKEREAS